MLSVDIRSSYEKIFDSAISTIHMKRAFEELSKHIRRFTGSPVDSYLTDNNLQVLPTYAQLSRIYGDTISSENIRSE